MAGRKKQQQQGSSEAAAAESGRRWKGKRKEAREDVEEEPARETRKRRGRENDATAREEDAEESPARQRRRRARGEPEPPATAAKAQHKGKEIVVREEGEEEVAAAAAAAAKGVGQQFFKVFFPDQSTERLKIPPQFHQHLEEQPTKSVSLKGPSGNIWQVALESDSEGLCFGQGWKEFAGDHSLKLGDFLVFTYEGSLRFSVTVFCSLGVVSPQALAAKPASALVSVKVEDDEGVQGDMDAGGGGTPEVAEVPLAPVEGNGITGKRSRGMDDLLTDGNASKRHASAAKKAEKRPEAINRTSKRSSAIAKSKKDALISLLDESATGNKTHIREKNVPRLGKFVTMGNRQPVVISQRRPVTEEEKDLALRRAKEFRSKHPFSIQIMMESYVYVGFFMNIPCEFVREWLPRTNKKMTLWDPLGKSWVVNYVYYSDRSVASFSGGWGKFALGNNLEKFDVCVFELFKEDNIKVYIYRVVPEITPLLRASKRQ